MVIAGAIGVIVLNQAVHAALGLVLTLFGVAVHFVAMEAHFLAVVQVIVYAGAIVVLIMFVIMLLGVDRAEDLRVEPLPIQRPLAAVLGVAIVALLVAAIFAARDSGPLQTGVGLDVEVREPADADVADDGDARRQHQTAQPQPVRRPGLRLRAHRGAARRRRRRHGRDDPPRETGETGSSFMAFPGHAEPWRSPATPCTASAAAGRSLAGARSCASTRGCIRGRPDRARSDGDVVSRARCRAVRHRRGRGARASQPARAADVHRVDAQRRDAQFRRPVAQRRHIDGQTAVFFILVVAAAEAVVGLGIIVAILRRRPGATADDLTELRG